MSKDLGAGCAPLIRMIPHMWKGFGRRNTFGDNWARLRNVSEKNGMETKPGIRNGQDTRQGNEGDVRDMI